MTAAPVPRSLGFRTDLMLLVLAGSTVDEAGGGLTVVRTPSDPGYWWGNFVLAESRAAAREAAARFAALVPGAAHVAIGVDHDDGRDLEAEAAALGLEVERTTVVTANRLEPPPHPGGGAELRRLASDADFEASVALQLANHPRDGRAFHAARVAAWRALQDAGHGAWFGAFVDGALRCGLGLFTDGAGLARFQSVDTHPAFRGRGLAGTLVHHAGTEALGRWGVERLVIVADPGDAAIRIYRRLGFIAAGSDVQLFRPPPGDAA